MSKYFVTGGSGFLGSNLCRYLLDKGHEVISFHQNPRATPARKGFVDIVGDIRDGRALSRAMRGADIIVHVAAVIAHDSDETLRSTIVDGTRAVFAAAHENAIARVIHISSTAVYGSTTPSPMREDAQLKSVDAYGEAKVQAEQICEEFRRKGMTVSVLRPKSIIGPGRLGLFAMFFEWARTAHNFPILGDGKNKYQHLDVDDMCDVIYLCSTLIADVVNDTFNIGAKEFTASYEEYQAVLDHAGFGKKIIRFPTALVIGLLRALTFLHISPLDPLVYETAAKDSFVSIEKAERKLSFRPKYSNTAMLLRSYDWYVEHYRELPREVPSFKSFILRLAKLFF
jgi:nucleoside-diphosphate-sugar epimerase